jgi:hypothetical protein
MSKQVYAYIGGEQIQAYLEKRAARIAKLGPGSCLSIDQLKTKIRRCNFCQALFLRPTEYITSTYCSGECNSLACRHFERDGKIVVMRAQGHTYAEIGRAFQLTGYRVSQIVKDYQRRIRQY